MTTKTSDDNNGTPPEVTEIGTGNADDPDITLPPLTKTVKLIVPLPVIVNTGLLSVVPCIAYKVCPVVTGKLPVDSLNGMFPESSVNVDNVPIVELLINVAFQLGVGVGVGVPVGVLVGVSVGVLVGVSVGVLVGVSLGVLVGVSVLVGVGVLVGVSLGVLVGVSVGVSVGVLVGVSLGVLVGVSVGVGV